MTVLPPVLHPGRHGLDLLGVLAANAVVLVLYFAYELTLLQLSFVLWWECVWIGLVSWLKLLVTGFFGRPFDSRHIGFDRSSTILITLIALAFIAGKYLAVLVTIAVVISAVAVELLGVDGVDLLRQVIDPVLAVAAWLLLGHAIAFVADFLLGRGFRTASWLGLIGWSYGRLGALLLAMLAALVWIAAFPDRAQLFAAVLILAKLIADSVLMLIERSLRRAA